MDWVEFASRFGLPTAFLAFIVWFLVAKVWPFVTNAWNEQQKERREEREKFLETLDKQTDTFQELMANAQRDSERARYEFLAELEKQRQEAIAGGRRGRGGQGNKDVK